MSKAMATVIKHQEDLPDWFSLAKYDDAKKLDVFGWYEQFATRDFISKTLLLDQFMPVRELLERVRESPLLDVRRSDPSGPVLYCTQELSILAMSAREDAGLRYTSGVRLATIGDFILGYRMMPIEQRRYVKQMAEGEIDPAEFSRFGTLLDGYSFESAVSGELNFRVNMAISDDLLVKEFEGLLKDLRAAGVESGRPRDPPFHSWVSYGVLPYIDLRTWALETGKSIPNRVMAGAIFPRGRGGEETVRKTTSVHANAALNEDNLSQLAALAAVEMRGKLEKPEQKVG